LEWLACVKREAPGESNQVALSRAFKPESDFGLQRLVAVVGEWWNGRYESENNFLRIASQ